MKPSFLIYGAAKVGKTTFASKIPGAIFACFERGLDNIPGAKTITGKLDPLKSSAEFMRHLPQKSVTLVVDSVSELFALMERETCAELNITDMGQKKFGAGYKHLTPKWEGLIRDLFAWAERTNSMLVLLGHSNTRMINDPLRDPFERWELAIRHRGSRDFLVRQISCIGYAELAPNITDDGKVKGFRRLLRFELSPSYESGCYYDLKDCGMDWSEVAKQFAALKKARKSDEPATTETPTTEGSSDEQK